MSRVVVLTFLAFENTDILGEELRLLGFISGLSKKDGFCYASDEYLAEKCNCSERTIRRQLKHLSELNVLKIVKKKDNQPRKIFIILDCVDENNDNEEKKDIDNQDNLDIHNQNEKKDIDSHNVLDMHNHKNGVPTDKKINNKSINKEKEIYKEKESPAFIKLPLKDGGDFIVSEEYLSELITQHEGKAVRDELKKMRAWLLDKPQKERKTLRGIHRFICNWLTRANKCEDCYTSPDGGNSEIDRTKQYIKEQDELMEKNKNGYSAFLAMRERRNAVSLATSRSPFHPPADK